MSTNSKLADFEIAPGFRAKFWKGLTLNEQDFSSVDWSIAIEILRARIHTRFIDPAQHLIDAEKENERGINGFVVLAIAFLLIETIQGFRSGLRSHDKKSKELFKAFLANWPAFTACVPVGKNASDLAVSVFKQGRCALHHTGSTDRLIVRKSGELFVFHEDDCIVINRSLLHLELTKEFNGYIASLKAPENAELRKNFKLKMDYICS